MSVAPERIWIDGAVSNNRWHDRKADCTLNGVASQGYVRDDLAGQDEFFFSAMDELTKLRGLLEKADAEIERLNAAFREVSK